MDPLRVAILGSGNVGTDLLYKLRRDPLFSIALISGIDPESQGLRLAKDLGYSTSHAGVDAILKRDDIDVVFDATSAKAHLSAAPLLKEQTNAHVIDLTPAHVGPFVVPPINLADYKGERNVNLISCVAQATIPIVAAVSQKTPLAYAEIVSTVSSRSIGPGTRNNIEEFTTTTKQAIQDIGGAHKAKVITVINPAEPPITMRNTIYTAIGTDTTNDAIIIKNILDIAKKVQTYVPGYRLTVLPHRRNDFLMSTVEVEGAGDFLPKYAGNLDIITAAAIAVAKKYAEWGAKQ